MIAVKSRSVYSSARGGAVRRLRAAGAVMLIVGVARAQTNAELTAPSRLSECLTASSAADRATCYAGVATKTEMRAKANCVRFGMASECLLLRGGDAQQACYDQCIEARDDDMNALEVPERDACTDRYVASEGRGHNACVIDGATPNVNVSRMQADIGAALRAHNGAALDALIEVADGEERFRIQTDCTKACVAWGSNVVAALKQGPALRTAYKRCMVDADSTADARKWAAYETDLYCDYLHQADVRCRAASRCDWLGKYSTIQCAYVSPGVEVCQ